MCKLNLLVDLPFGALSVVRYKLISLKDAGCVVLCASVKGFVPSQLKMC